MSANYNPLQAEKEILEFWKFDRIYEKAKQKNKDKQKYYRN